MSSSGAPQLPEHLAKRFEAESERFGKIHQTAEDIEKDLEAAAERKAALDSSKSEAAGAEVAKAKQVAEHNKDTSGHSAKVEAKLQELKSEVDELKQLEAQLRETEEKEARLKARLEAASAKGGKVAAGSS